MYLTPTYFKTSSIMSSASVDGADLKKRAPEALDEDARDNSAKRQRLEEKSNEGPEQSI